MTTLVLLTANLSIVEAAPKKTYLEMEFIQTFNGKDKKYVLTTLGEPFKKQIPVKPSTSESFVGKAVPTNNKQEVIEMWYYSNLVKYNAKDTFKKTEVTFINDKCTNITFVN